jgi:hypothetical protein
MTKWIILLVMVCELAQSQPAPMPLLINPVEVETNNPPTYHIKLAWNGQTNETYSIGQGGSPNVYTNQYFTSNNVYTVSNLYPGNVYYFSVSAWSNGLQSPWSASLQWPWILTNWIVIQHQWSYSPVSTNWSLWTNGDIFQPGSQGQVFFRDYLFESNNINCYEKPD